MWIASLSSPSQHAWCVHVRQSRNKYKPWLIAKYPSLIATYQSLSDKLKKKMKVNHFSRKGNGFYFGENGSRGWVSISHFKVSGYVNKTKVVISALGENALKRILLMLIAIHSTWNLRESKQNPQNAEIEAGEKEKYDWVLVKEKR